MQGLVDMTSWLYKCLPWGRAWPKLRRPCLRLAQILLLADLTGAYQIFNQTAFFHHHSCTITSDLSFQALDDPKATCGYLHGTEACYSYKATCRIRAAERSSDFPSLPGSQEALEQEAKGLGGLSKGLTAADHVRTCVSGAAAGGPRSQFVRTSTLSSSASGSDQHRAQSYRGHTSTRENSRNSVNGPQQSSAIGHGLGCPKGPWGRGQK